jgi:hypothetical protein
MITAVKYNLARSSSRLGHGPLKAGARVRVPYALPGGLAHVDIILQTQGLASAKKWFKLPADVANSWPERKHNFAMSNTSHHRFPESRIELGRSTKAWTTSMA